MLLLPPRPLVSLLWPHPPRVVSARSLVRRPYLYVGNGRRGQQAPGAGFELHLFHVLAVELWIRYPTSFGLCSFITKKWECYSLPRRIALRIKWGHIQESTKHIAEHTVETQKYLGFIFLHLEVGEPGWWLKEDSEVGSRLDSSGAVWLGHTTTVLSFIPIAIALHPADTRF